jgi:hypothetical protein
LISALAVKERVDELVAHGGYHRLILVVGPARSGKTTALRAFAEGAGWPRVNLNLMLAERLLEVPSRFRQIRVLDLLRDAAEAAPGDGLVLDNIELLFQRSLELDPLPALLALSRSRVVVAAWCGELADGALTYAAPDHPEFRSYTAPACMIVTAGIAAFHSPPPSTAGSFA